MHCWSTPINITVSTAENISCGQCHFSVLVQLCWSLLLVSTFCVIWYCLLHFVLVQSDLGFGFYTFSHNASKLARDFQTIALVVNWGQRHAGGRLDMRFVCTYVLRMIHVPKLRSRIFLYLATYCAVLCVIILYQSIGIENKLIIVAKELQRDKLVSVLSNERTNLTVKIASIGLGSSVNASVESSQCRVRKSLQWKSKKVKC